MGWHRGQGSGLWPRSKKVCRVGASLCGLYVLVWVLQVPPQPSLKLCIRRIGDHTDLRSDCEWVVLSCPGAPPRPKAAGIA